MSAPYPLLGIGRILPKETGMIFISDNPTKLVVTPDEHREMYGRFLPYIKEKLMKCDCHTDVAEKLHEVEQVWKSTLNNYVSPKEHVKILTMLSEDMRGLVDSCLYRLGYDNTTVVKIPFHLENLIDNMMTKEHERVQPANLRSTVTMNKSTIDTAKATLHGKVYISSLLSQFFSNFVDPLKSRDQKNWDWCLDAEEMPDDDSFTNERRKFYDDFDKQESLRYSYEFSHIYDTVLTQEQNFALTSLLSQLAVEASDYASSLLRWLTFDNASEAYEVTKQEDEYGNAYDVEKIYRRNKANKMLLHMLKDEIGAIFLVFQLLMYCSLSRSVDNDY